MIKVPLTLAALLLSPFSWAVPCRDVVYHNGNVYTADDTRPHADGFIVRGDRFVVVGTTPELRAAACHRARWVDLGGQTVIPGLIDSHDHLWNTAKFLYRGVDMVGVTSRGELLGRLKAAVDRGDNSSAIFTSTGWSVTPWPSRAELDEISATVPIAVIAQRRGSGVLNSAALRRLGISAEHPEFDGYRVPVDGEAQPTGVLPGYPASVLMLDALLPKITVEEQDRILIRAMQERNALGMTSIRELAAWPEEIAALSRLRAQGKLSLRMAVGVESPQQSRTVEYLNTLPIPDRTDPWLFLDSVSEEPWVPGTTDLEGFQNLLKAEDHLHWRPAPHVSADRRRNISAQEATDATLRAYEFINSDSALAAKRWYVEHVPWATPEQIARMAALHLIVSTQDAGYRTSGDPKDAGDPRHQNPVRSFIDQGLTVIGGSDYAGPTPGNLQPNNLLATLGFYVTRRNQAGEVLTGAEAVSRQQALKIFTANAAYATFQESVKGRIAAGALADFVVVDQDLMTVPEDRISQTTPLATYGGGRRVFGSGPMLRKSN